MGATAADILDVGEMETEGEVEAEADADDEGEGDATTYTLSLHWNGCVRASVNAKLATTVAEPSSSCSVSAVERL